MESKSSSESLLPQPLPLPHAKRSRWRLRATIGVCIVLLFLNLVATLYQIRVQVLPPSKKTYSDYEFTSLSLVVV